MKKKTRALRNSLIFLFLIITAAVFVSAEEIHIDFAREGKSNLFQEKGALLVEKQNTSFIMLEENEHRVDGHTDMLLHFNRLPLFEDTGNYRISHSNIRLLSRNAWRAQGSAIFQEEPAGIVISPRRNDALFSSENVWKDFTIDFWMYPATARDGEVVFLWRGVRWRNQEEFFSQEIRCSFVNRKLVWQFTNFFLPPEQGSFSVQVEPVSSLIPRQWHHHMLRFDSSTGRIEYLIDGQPEAIAYANPDNRETGTVYLPYTGRASQDPITIGSAFTGFLDDFRVSDIFREDFSLSRYRMEPGEILTGTVDLGFEQSMLQTVNVDAENPPETEILYYYRISDSLDEEKNPWGSDWILFSPGDNILDNNKGRYVQLKARLFTNGSHDRSPIINSFTLEYEPETPPPPPSGVIASNQNGKIHVQWNAVPGTDIAGYKLYFGTKPGHYFGVDAQKGNSPLDVGNQTEIILEGLTPYQIYYFCVVAYDSSLAAHQSQFSREVSARAIRMQP